MTTNIERGTSMKRWARKRMQSRGTNTANVAHIPMGNERGPYRHGMGNGSVFQGHRVGFCTLEWERKELQTFRYTPPPPPHARSMHPAHAALR
ncbi:hypothetical protein CDAR_274041 [Caerostris darwini]|uniref:Uncharacterized protein n=1 Tax=Caerostris darwini TaxID=1538125 RepID=A0AAV4RCL6_9ARAC|nr:hypothetical protein CDAR_274041 [Caerostris darwini]